MRLVGRYLRGVLRTITFTGSAVRERTTPGSAIPEALGLGAHPRIWNECPDRWFCQSQRGIERRRPGYVLSACNRTPRRKQTSQSSRAPASLTVSGSAQ